MAGIIGTGIRLFADMVTKKKRADALAASGADVSKPVPVEQQPQPEPMDAAGTLAPPVDPTKRKRPGAAQMLAGRSPLSGGLL